MHVTFTILEKKGSIQSTKIPHGMRKSTKGRKLSIHTGFRHRRQKGEKQN
jgi:hypothetical protein